MHTGRDIFVIMPFSATESCTENEWSEIFENIFKPAIEENGYSCERAVSKTGSLISSIIERLRNSRVVLADITDKNPNVFYELGVRHSLSKRTIIVCQNTKSIPSDLRGYWTIQYGIRPAQVIRFKTDMKRILSEIELNPDKSDSPVSDYLEREQISVHSYIQRDNIKKLGALFTELSGNILAVDKIQRNYRISHVSGSLISTDCLSLLLQTFYIDIGPDLLKQGYELMSKLRALQYGVWSDETLKGIISELKSFGDSIFSIKEKLSLGEYREPVNISTMIWMPSHLRNVGCQKIVEPLIPKLKDFVLEKSCCEVMADEPKRTSNGINRSKRKRKHNKSVQ